MLLAGGATGSAQEETDTTTDGGEDEPPASATENGMVTVAGGESVEATVETITTAIEEGDLTLLTTVDHAENASSADLELRQTTLLIFGNPAAGTPLMQSAQTTGIDLPQKILVWEADDGAVWVTYNDPTWVADRHTIEGQEELLGNIADSLESIATSAEG